MGKQNSNNRQKGNNQKRITGYGKNRIYHYHVSIRFKGNGPTYRIGRRCSEYFGSQGFKDAFVFFQKSCSMVLCDHKC